MDETLRVQLQQAFSGYLEAGLGGSQEAVQQELSRFVRYCGRDSAVQSLTPMVVAGYCGTLEGLGDDRSLRVSFTKGFLAYLHNQGWTSTNLATHVKLRRTGRRGPAQPRKKRPVGNQLTAEGHDRLQDELATLKSQRVTVAEEIRLAAATKDFSENAPLDAAREHQGQLEARIRELETLLKDATILDDSAGGKGAKSRIGVGTHVVLRHVPTGRQVRYHLVESKEADPTEGKISAASPVGKAVLDRAVGDEVTVETPRGSVGYVIADIGR